jgi:Legionella pneumophila major outer membrane protein precursor
MRFRSVVFAFGIAAALASTARAQDPGPGFGVGTDILYLRPTFSDNAANSVKQFEWGADRSHAIWAGYTLESGWGIRYNAFLFDGDATKQQLNFNTPTGVSTPDSVWPYGISSPSAVLSAGLGQDQLWFRSHLRVLKEELEGTYGWWETDWSVQLSAGVRYQLIRQNYDADLSNDGDGVTRESLALRTSREFVGFGPTAGIFGTYHFAESWSVYGKFRGAIAYGSEDRQAVHSGAISDPNLVLGTGNSQVWGSSRQVVDRVIPITELELGIEYATDLGPLHVYFRGGIMAQTYYNAGAAAGGGGNLSMFGGQFSLGFRY